MGSRKYTIEIIKELFEKEGYTLLSTEYQNTDTKLEYICPKGHKSITTMQSWRKSRCPFCSGRRKYTLDSVRDTFNKENYILLEKEYKNDKYRMRYICPLGHEGKISISNWNTGERCRQCGIIRRNNKNRTDFDTIKNEIEKKGWTLLENTYVNAFKKMKILCPNGHVNYKRWNDFQQGYGCQKCYAAKKVSDGEKEILNILDNYFNCIKENDRTLIYPKELDIFLPEKNTAIEYCGLYWHSEKRGKDKNYHLNKLNACNKKGVRLITIFEDEWVHKQNIVKNMLLNKLGLSTSKRIYARNCIIKEVDNKTKNEFLDKYHIQGTDNSSIKLGAFCENELVSIMTFAKLNIAKGMKSEEGSIELSRFCSNFEYSVIGIASKLLKYFKNNYLEYENIISFSDRRWSDGNLYKKLGFEFIHNTNPNYWYIKYNKRIHRFNFRKSVLVDKLDNFDPNLSEWENMKLNGYDRIWDCGNLKWILRK